MALKKIHIQLLTIILTSSVLFGCFGNYRFDRDNAKKEKLITQLKQYNWEEPEKAINLVEPSIYLTEGSNHNTGMSKYGGTPDLPTTLKWPTYKEEPMVFFGQINLEQASDFDKENQLLKKGVLYFFAYYKAPESEYGAEYNFQIAKEKYKVLYYEGDIKNVNKTEFPETLPLVYHFKEEPITMEVDYGLPTPYSYKQVAAGFSENDKKLYEEVLEEYEYFQGETILGTPCPIQDPVEFDWAYSYLQSTDYKNEQIKAEVNTLRPNFINLLSFGMWGKFESIGISDCYFGILKNDLENKDFSKAIFVMQDT